jgi:hypothetical protein
MSSLLVLGSDSSRIRLLGGVTLGKGSASLIPPLSDMKTVVIYISCVSGKAFPEEVSLLYCYTTGEFRVGSGRIQPRPYLTLAERKHCMKLGTPQSDLIGETKSYPSTSLLPLGPRYNPTTVCSDCPFSRAACYMQLYTRSLCDSDTTALRRHS